MPVSDIFKTTPPLFKGKAGWGCFPPLFKGRLGGDNFLPTKGQSTLNQVKNTAFFQEKFQKFFEVKKQFQNFFEMRCELSTGYPQVYPQFYPQPKTGGVPCCMA